MFASFLFPFPVRNTPAPYLWIFYKQLTCFSSDEVLYIGSPDYFQQEKHEADNRVEVGEGCVNAFGYRVPSARDVASILRAEIPGDVFDELNRKYPAPNHAWRVLLTEPYPALQSALETILARALQEQPLEGILTWCNCPSLSEAARKYNLPVIHNELGALRLPHFHPTCYFDRRGVNGHTDAEARLANWRSEHKDSAPDLLSREEILGLTLKEPDRLFAADCSCEFEIGLALQIEDDSNIIAFAHGLSNYDLITTANKSFSREEILIRKHPAGRCQYGDEFGIRDDSPTSLDFLKRCKRIATVNSSVGLEALLFDRPTCILGDNPFRHLARTSLEELLEPRTAQPAESLLRLNHAVFGYLVPYDLLFDASYYRWRLTNPSESEIVRFHQKFYLSQQASVADVEGLNGPAGSLILMNHNRRIAADLQKAREKLHSRQNAEQLLRVNEEQLRKAELHLREREEQRQALGVQLRLAREQLQEKDAALRDCHATLQVIYQSRSWKLLTRYRAARRWVGKGFKRIKPFIKHPAAKQPEPPLIPVPGSGNPVSAPVAPISATRLKHAIERQMAASVTGIEPGHVARYELCLQQLPLNATVLDAACGCGYGTSLLRRRATEVVGVDISLEAIKWARQHYLQEGIKYFNADLLDPYWIDVLEGQQFDAVVSLETLEHFPDPYDYLETLAKSLKPGGLLMVSTPNPVAYPLYVDGQRINPFHFKHWAIDELEALMKQLGFEIKTWFTQLGTDFTEQDDLSRGRFLIAAFAKPAAAGRAHKAA